MKHFTQPSFSAQFVYAMIPSNHYLVKVDELVDWERYGRKIRMHGYKGQGELGQPIINPAILLKMLFLCHLYDLSERDCEEQVNFNIVMKYFCDLVPEERSPDHTTLSFFKQRILATNRATRKNILKEIFDDILLTGTQHGLQPSSIRVIDAGHIVSNVNNDKENRRKYESKKNNTEYTPRDTDAQWGCKKSITVDTNKKIPLYFHGYKEHVSYDPTTNLVTEVQVTSGEVYDGHHFQCLIDAEMKKKHMKPRQYINAPRNHTNHRSSQTNHRNSAPINQSPFTPRAIKLVPADKGYDDGNNHEYLKQKNIRDAIILKDTRTKKKDSNKEIWLELEKSPYYQHGTKVRKEIEKVFGDGKHWHGLGRCRYLGMEKTKIQVYMTNIVFNLKSITKQLFGVTFRNQQYHYGG